MVADNGIISKYDRQPPVLAAAACGTISLTVEA
jgi:hypothetical protein